MLDLETKKSPVGAGLFTLDLCDDNSTAERTHSEFSRREAKLALAQLSLTRPEGVAPRSWAPATRTRLVATALIDAAATRQGVSRNGRPFAPGCVFLSVATIAQRCWIDRVSVQRSLRVLVTLGVIEVAARGGGRGSSTMYRLRIGWRAAAKADAGGDAELRAELAVQRKEIERLRAELAAQRSDTDGDSEIVVSRSEQQSEPETPQKPNAARWVRKLIAAAYKSQLRDRYGIGHTRAVKETTMALYVSFAERMSIELVTDIRDVVESTVRIYFDQPGKDSRLRDQCHPLGWMEHDLATIERQLRREHRRKKRRRAPPAAEETPRMTPREAATRAAQIAAAIKRSAA